VFQSSLWVLGGAVDQPDPDGWMLTEAVYFSSDGGGTWTQAPDPPWRPRWWATGVAAVFDDRLWIFGGWTFDNLPNPIDDAWFTRDGQSWVAAAAVPWGSNAFAARLVPAGDVLYVLTADFVGNAAMWQMDAEQRWTAAPAPPFGFWPEPYYPGFGPGCSSSGGGLIAVGQNVWRYVPPLAGGTAGD
jgi:hypothetical protein